MDPQPLGPVEWAAIGAAVTYLLIAAGLAVSAALALVLGGLVAPLLGGPDSSGLAALPRRLLFPLAAVALLLAALALGRGLALAVETIQRYYPRFLI